MISARKACRAPLSPSLPSRFSIRISLSLSLSVANRHKGERVSCHWQALRLYARSLVFF